MRFINRHKGVFVAAAVLFLASCSDQRSPFSPAEQQAGPATPFSAAMSSATASPDTINYYEVRFDGRVYAGGQTTFTYTVSGTGVPENLSHFIVELPPCAPQVSATSPAGAVIHTDPETGLYGVDWSIDVGPAQNQTYSITFPGDVPLGVVRGQVTRKQAFLGPVSSYGPVRVLGTILGPCAGAVISGFVYTDADSNGVLDGVESGIADVTVRLEDGLGHSDAVRTDASGAFMFVAVDGTYTIHIDAATPASDQNETLALYFDASGPTSRLVTVGPNSPFNNFGFTPSVGRIIEDLKSGDLVTTGRTVNFWRHEIRRAITGNGESTYDAATLLSFIHEIEALALPLPFRFTPGNELREAYALLSISPQDDEDLVNDRMKEKVAPPTGGGVGNDETAALLRELLATEFNHVATRGLVSNLSFQLTLIAWGEVLLNEGGTQALGGISSEVIVPLAGTSFSDATDLFKKLNGATGGGGTN